MQTNKLMENFVQTAEPIKTLPEKLKQILRDGFIFENGCVFFKSFELEIDAYDFDVDVVKERFLDFSGFEHSLNKFHIEDFCESHLFPTALLFVKEFRKAWQKSMTELGCVSTLSFQQCEEFGDIATFTFHVLREDEAVINTDELEKFTQPIAVDLIIPVLSS